MQSQLRTVTGETAPILERTTVPLTVGTFETQQDMWVAEIAVECILGLDFLQCNDCQVNMKEGVLHIGNEEVQLQQPQVSEPTCCRCCASATITLPPYSESIVQAKVEGDWTTTGKWVMLQADKSTLARNGVLVGKTLVDLQKQAIPVQLLNLSQQPQQIQNGITLVNCEPVLRVLPTDLECAQTDVSQTETCDLTYTLCMIRLFPICSQIKEISCIPCYISMPIFSPRGHMI